MSTKKIVRKTKIDVDQFAELNAAVTRCLPRDMDLDTAQKWIEDKQRILAGVLRTALMSPKEQIEKVIFKASEKFHPGTTDGVKISYVDPEFADAEEEIYGKVVVPKKAFDLPLHMYPSEVLEYSRSSNKKLTISTPSGIWKLLKLQGKGQREGCLLIGGMNIFFVKLYDVLRAVDVYWVDDGWFVYVLSVDNHRGWNAGQRVFSGGKSAEPCIIEA